MNHDHQLAFRAYLLAFFLHVAVLVALAQLQRAPPEGWRLERCALPVPLRGLSLTVQSGRLSPRVDCASGF